MINEDEIKAKYFAQYLGSEFIYSETKDDSTTTLDLYALKLMIEDNDFNECTLCLKPIQSISDEDRLLIANTEYSHRNFKVIKNLNGDGTFDFVRESGSVALCRQNVFLDNTPKKVDILRQLGYAIDYTTIVDGKVVTYSVQDLINKGWIKLTHTN